MSCVVGILFASISMTIDTDKFEEQYCRRKGKKGFAQWHKSQFPGENWQDMIELNIYEDMLKIWIWTVPEKSNHNILEWRVKVSLNSC